jgi:hypothetical protein
VNRSRLMSRILANAASFAVTAICFAALLEAVFVLGGYLPGRAW